MAGVALALSATLAACGGSADRGSSAGDSSTSAANVVSVKRLGDAGDVLVDPRGHALYAADQETRGKVLCTGECNSFWTPLTASKKPTGGPVADQLGLAKRPDGARQVTYDGKLLYSFTEDPAGQVTGDGFKDTFAGRRFTWHVVRGDGASSAPARPTAGSGSSSGY